MAARRVVLFDDIDGTEAVETITFSLDGETYEIDLGPENARKLREALAVFVKHARKVSKDRSRKGSPENRLIRDWLRSQGYIVSPRGKIPKRLVELYRAHVGDDTSQEVAPRRVVADPEVKACGRQEVPAHGGRSGDRDTPSRVFETSSKRCT